MNIEKRIETLEKSFKKEMAEIKEQLKKEKMNSRFKPEDGQIYFFVDSAGYTFSREWCSAAIDIYHFKIRNCFRTEEEAQEYQRWLDIKYSILDIAEELGRPTDEEWKNEYIKKYFIYYDFRQEIIRTDWVHMDMYEDIYCLSNKFLDVCLERIGKEDLEFYIKNTKFV